jgi:hypothetical protein
MTNDDSIFPFGRTYIYIVRPRSDMLFPLKQLYFSYSTAVDEAIRNALASGHPYDVEVYEESFDHKCLKHGVTYKMTDNLNEFVFV